MPRRATEIQRIVKNGPAQGMRVRWAPRKTGDGYPWVSVSTGGTRGWRFADFEVSKEDAE